MQNVPCRTCLACSLLVLPAVPLPSHPWVLQGRLLSGPHACGHE